MVLWCGAVRTSRTMLFASSFDLSEDSTFVIHDFVLTESSNSFTLSLCEILSTPRRQSRLLRVARFTRIARLTFRESASSFASSVDNSSLLRCQVALVLSEKLVDTVGDMLVDLARPILERFLVRHITDCDDVVCFRLSTYPGILNWRGLLNTVTVLLTSSCSRCSS